MGHWLPNCLACPFTGSNMELSCEWRGRKCSSCEQGHGKGNDVRACICQASGFLRGDFFPQGWPYFRWPLGPQASASLEPCLLPGG